MKIQYKNYLIVPCDSMVDRFDLFKIVERQRLGTGTKAEPNGEVYSSTSDIGYGMRLKNVFTQLVTIETQESFEKDEITSITEYIDRFKKEREALEAYIESVTTV